MDLPTPRRGDASTVHYCYTHRSTALPGVLWESSIPFLDTTLLDVPWRRVAKPRQPGHQHPRTEISQGELLYVDRYDQRIICHCRPGGSKFYVHSRVQGSYEHCTHSRSTLSETLFSIRVVDSWPATGSSSAQQNQCHLFYFIYHTTCVVQYYKWKKCSERCKHCALAVVRLSQKFSPRRRPPSRGCGTARI